jgi:repressor of nif and glnA expression
MRAVLRVLREAGEPLTAKVIRTRLGAGAGSGGPRGALRQLAALGLAKRLRAGTWWLMEWGEPPEEVAED